MVTTISVQKKTLDRFNSFGVKGDTSDELLNRILDAVEEEIKKGEGDFDRQTVAELSKKYDPNKYDYLKEE